MLASPSLSNFPVNLTTPRGLDFSKWEAKLFLCRISSLNIAFLIFFIYLIYFTSKTRITIHTGKCMIFPRTSLSASNFAFYFDALSPTLGHIWNHDLARAVLLLKFLKYMQQLITILGLICKIARGFFSRLKLALPCGWPILGCDDLM